MRREMTEPERRLWREMRQRIPIEGTHFRRQVPIDRYIVDFCAFAANVVVEVDGNQHGADDAIAYDAMRTARLKQLGYRVLRFSNQDVMTNIEAVLDTIFANLPAPETLTPGPSPQLAKVELDAPSHPSPLRGGAGAGAKPIHRSPRTRAARTQEP